MDRRKPPRGFRICPRTSSRLGQVPSEREYLASRYEWWMRLDGRSNREKWEKSSQKGRISRGDTGGLRRNLKRRFETGCFIQAIWREWTKMDLFISSIGQRIF